MPEILPVLFRMSAGECVAVFPTLDARSDPNAPNRSRITCYAHIGQHGDCSYGWYTTTKKAKPEQYADLLAELRGIYEHSHAPDDPVYTLQVIERWPARSKTA